MSELTRIVVFGPESTGKSTMAAQLAAHYAEPWSKEYVRLFWDEHDGRIGPSDLDLIARGQIAVEDEATQKARKLVVHDTDLLTCVLWDDVLFAGHCPDWVRKEADVRAAKTALYLFCEIDLPWDEDPQRCFPDQEGRAMSRRIWLEALTSRGVSYALVSGDGEARLRHAIVAVDAYLAKRDSDSGS